MPFVQSVDNAREDRVGRNGVSAPALRDALAKSGDALAWLRARHADGALRLLQLPAERADLAAISEAAGRLRKDASDIVFLGTGGSSLGGQTLAQLADYAVPGLGALRAAPRMHFMDNLDPHTFAGLLAKLPLATSRFVAISKSGDTPETLMQVAALLAALKAAKLQSRIPDLCLGVSEPARTGKRNGLRELLSAHGVSLLDHDPAIGGRFSVLSNVGLLPAAMLGLDIGAVREGAGRALAPVLADKPPGDVPAALGAALAVALAANGKSISVMMAYADRLQRFTKWYVQLWAESLGKDGRGTTPLAALGPVDQHSQLQLFIGGPRDKLFTIVTRRDAAGAGPRIPADLAKLAGEESFAGKSIGDLVAAQSRATAETLAKNGCPVRSIELERLDERHLGELLMHFMLETVIAARLLGVDAFDQPAVEEGKVLAKKYLASPS
jgi:glucose-6-phosphate isomerase